MMIMIRKMKMTVGWNEVFLPNEKEKNCELVWTDSAHLEQKKRGPYLTGTTKKSTYFDKYGPSGSFTKAAKGTLDILTLINKQSNPENKHDQLNLKERIEGLRIELKEKQKSFSVSEFNKTRAIFEYLKRLDDNG